MMINQWIWLPSVSFSNRMWSRPYWTVIPVIERRHIIWLPRPLRWINVTQMRKNVTLKIETLFFRIENESWMNGKQARSWKGFFCFGTLTFHLLRTAGEDDEGRRGALSKICVGTRIDESPKTSQSLRRAGFSVFQDDAKHFDTALSVSWVLTKRPRATEIEFNQQSNTVWNSVSLADVEMGIVSSKHLSIGALVCVWYHLNFGFQYKG